MPTSEPPSIKNKPTSPSERHWPCRYDPWGWAGTGFLWSASGTTTEVPRCRRSPARPRHYGSPADPTWCLWQWWFCRFLRYLCWRQTSHVQHSVMLRVLSWTCLGFRLVDHEMIRNRTFTLPCDITDVSPFVHHHVQRTSSGSKHVQRLRVARQLLSRSSSQDDGPAAGLGHTVLTGLKRAASSTLDGQLTIQSSQISTRLTISSLNNLGGEMWRLNCMNRVWFPAGGCQNHICTCLTEIITIYWIMNAKHLRQTFVLTPHSVKRLISTN